MKKTFILFATLLSTLALISFKPIDKWIKVETANCKIYFPQKPTGKSEIVNTAKGDLKINIFLYQATPAKNDDNLAYILSETEYPDSVMNSEKKDRLEAFFKNSIDGVVQRFNGTLIEQTVTTLNGYPGRQVKLGIQGGKAVMNIRFYLVKNRMFVLQTITQSGKEDNTSIEKFMDSFEINE